MHIVARTQYVLTNGRGVNLPGGAYDHREAAIAEADRLVPVHDGLHVRRVTVVETSVEVYRPAARPPDVFLCRTCAFRSRPSHRQPHDGSPCARFTLASTLNQARKVCGGRDWTPKETTT